MALTDLVHNHIEFCHLEGRSRGAWVEYVVVPDKFDTAGAEYLWFGLLFTTVFLAPCWVIHQNRI